MLNRIVVGQTAKQFREAHGLQKDESISPHLIPERIALLGTLQNIDVGQLISVPDFVQRRRYLEWYATKHMTA